MVILEALGMFSFTNGLGGIEFLDGSVQRDRALSDVGYLFYHVLYHVTSIRSVTKKLS